MKFSQITQRIGNRFKQRFVPMYHGVLNKIRMLFGNPIVIDDASDEALKGLRIFGKSTQNGTPTPDAPVEIVSVENPIVNVGNQTLSVPYTLHGIRVTSGGNYTDANGQQWICDEVDFERGVYVQRINKITHDGTLGHFVTSHTNGQRYSTLKPNDVADIGIVLCDRYASTIWADTDKKIYLITGTIVITDSRFTDDEAVLSILQAEQPEILYPLGEPIEIPLTADQIEAYKSLHTNKPNTTIYNDQGAYMSVSYISK